MWPIIGARMGYVSFPATDSEPAKSGPGVATQLQHIHQEYLQQFDTIYVRSVLQKKGLFPNGVGPLQPGNPSGAPAQLNNTLVNNPTGSPAGNIPANQVSMVRTFSPLPSRTVLTSEQMNAVLMYANVSAAELRARGVAENIIHFVETNRTHLQRSVKQQHMFRGMVQNPNGPGPEQGMNVNGQFPQPSPGPVPNMAHNVARGPLQGLSPAGTSLAANNVQSQPPQQPLMNGAMHQQGTRPARPTPEQSQEAIQFIAKVKNEFMSKSEWFYVL